MIRCTFKLNGQGVSTFSCPGVGFFPAYSGNAGPYRNNPNYTATPDKGPLPKGRYFIVERPKGGLRTKVQDWFASRATGSDRDVWFALYKDDGQIDDYTFIGKVERGHFRLHPAGHSGVSNGCITFPDHSHFGILRAALLKTQKFRISPSLVAYGTVEVY